MNGRTHVSYGFGFVMIIAAALLWFAYGDATYAYPSLLAIGVGGAFGAFFPDFDIFWGIGAHRSTLTHSSILPLLCTISYAFTPSVEMRTLLMFVCIGMSTHLTMDLFLGDAEGNIVSRWAHRLAEFARGNVGGSFKGSGKDWANKHERAYLILHSFICLVCAVVLFWGIYNGVVIEGLFW